MHFIACCGIIFLDFLHWEGFLLAGQIIHIKGNEVPEKHKCEHKDYEYTKRIIVSREQAKQCAVSLYELPPGKCAYPYHFHTKNEEVFYIISGQGMIRTPDGEKAVSAGDFLFFPADEKGAHKLTNTSPDSNLVYIDFDSSNDIDITFYPDSGKIGVWGMNIDKVYKAKDHIDYYEGE